MFIALDSDKNRIHIDDISSDKEYFCPACGAPLVKRLGEIRIHHSAHKPDSPCSDEWYKDYDTSEWHDSWQNMFPAENQEIFVKNEEQLSSYLIELAKNQEKCIKLSKAARKKAKLCFEDNVVLPQYLQEISKIVY